MVVVGSGAGGGVVAAALAEAGRSVIVLEAGPFVDEASMPTNELDAFDRLYLDHGLTSTWDGSITILAGAAVGGGTLVNWMTSIAAPAGIRARWGREHGIEGLGDGADEPWSQDLDTIEGELDVTETAFLPPKDALILRGAAALGWEAAPTRRDAVGCDDCGSCPFGCRRGSKRSGIRVHLARAHVAGARIVPDTAARRLILDGERASGVEAVHRPSDGAERAVTVRARQVVLAAGALRSPSVLQRSGLDHPAIGRYLRLHPVTVVAGRMPFPVEMWRGPLQAARSLEFLEDEPGRNGYAIEAAPGHAGLLALALPWEGTEAHAGDMREASPPDAADRGHARRRGGPRDPDPCRERPARLSARRDRRRDASARASSAWRCWPGRVARATSSPHRRPRSGSGVDRIGGAVTMRHSLATSSGAVARPRAQPGDGVLGAPDGHGADGRGRPRRSRQATHGAGSGSTIAPTGWSVASTWQTPRSSRPGSGSIRC